MEIVLLTVGKTTTSYIRTGIEEYEKRLRRYIPFRMVSVPDTRTGSKTTPELQKKSEGEKILSELEPSDMVTLLDERGELPTSVGFSQFLNKGMLTGKKRHVFVTGGPYGFSKAVYDRADSLLSLSRMTFSHEMVRLFFVEQVYRAMTILRGEHYHHE